MPTRVSLSVALLFGVLSLALPNGDTSSLDSQNEELSLDVEARALSPYAPVSTPCPSGSLVRDATGISSSEALYIKERKPLADAGLEKWLKKTNAGFGMPSTIPTVALTSSGGGDRALLCAAGVHKAFDERDSIVSTGGLYQALTYEAGLSGGAWFLGSFSANDYPTIDQLLDDPYESGLENGLITPGGLASPVVLARIVGDVSAKGLAGFEPTLVDIYGRLLGYSFLRGNDGGVADTLSGVANLSNFTSHSVPFPIITAIGLNASDAAYTMSGNATQYEFSPYEFGSWDDGIAAFTPTQYIGSKLNAGKPSKSLCVTRYDNQGYIMGTSSDIFAALYLSFPASPLSDVLGGLLQKILDGIHQATTRDIYATYPNPFYNYSSSFDVSSDEELRLADGGYTGQNNPIWPLLHRDVDAAFVNDNSADTDDNFPDGSEIYNTYLQAKSQNLSRMPEIPMQPIFTEQGLNKRPTFFGCNDDSKMTIMYLPNTNYTFNSGQPTARIEYSKADTRAMVANGVLIGSYGANSTFATCVGCTILKKTDATLPAECQQCYKDFCYN